MAGAPKVSSNNLSINYKLRLVEGLEKFKEVPATNNIVDH